MCCDDGTLPPQITCGRFNDRMWIVTEGDPPPGVGAEINTISIVALENQGRLGSASRVDTWRVGFQDGDLRIQSHIRSVSTAIQ